LLFLGLAACGGGGSAPPSSSGTSSTIDQELVTLAKTQLGLIGDPATPRGLSQTLPKADPLVKLGELLFFSQTLAGGYDVSCGTCHHPDFGGADGLSIPVGVVPEIASAVGPGREVDPARDLDPSADGGPNMPRNSITTFNAALFDRAQMYDGRIYVLDDKTVAGGRGQNIQTPESGQRSDPDPLTGLLEFTVKAPIVNDNEMRGYLYTEYASPFEYREHLAGRLRGAVDTQYNSNPNGPANWLALFREAFDLPNAAAEEVVTMPNVQRALSAYVSSQIFVDTPWRAYLEGDMTALGEQAKQGAMLFFKRLDEGGLGCATCHSGDRFTDEAFHNVGFPQIGRGFQRADSNDLGRWGSTRVDADFQAFRTPSLLNVAMTAPYGHAGTFQTLGEAIRYHADPRRSVEDFDFTLGNLDQFRNSGVAYPQAEPHTREALARDSFAAAEALLPTRGLSSTEVAQLTAFLQSLTDTCVAAPICIGQWTPSEAEDPDGNMLVRDDSLTPPNVDASGPADYPAEISMRFPPTTPRATFADVESCVDGLAAQNNTGETKFTRPSEPSFGLSDPQGYDSETWFRTSSYLEITMIGGGVSAAYLTDDCWPDLIFTGGSASGMVVYKNMDGAYFQRVDLLGGNPGLEYTGTAIADLNGDYRRELLFGDLLPGALPIYSQDGTGQYVEIATLPMVRPTYGISFAPLDDTGYPYFFLSHWASGTGSNGGTSPGLWRNDGSVLSPWDVPAMTTSDAIDQQSNFTPKFADFTGDGLIDLVIASDFGTSSTSRNVAETTGGPVFTNETDRDVITDQNGMGSALLDIDNDGVLEWFVTSVYEDTGMPPAGNWGQTGNRLYRNISTADHIAFEDITSAAGVRDGYWGWGACAADVNNDGFIDLFHANGFGYIPDDVVVDDAQRTELQQAYLEKTEQFQNRRSRLFINDGDGTFTESSFEWSVYPSSEGRGLTCFDYDRDGDIDIAVFNHSADLHFFENQSGSGLGRHFSNIRLVGAPPNTDAIGAKVYLTADIGNGHGAQTQLRLSEANSNFNSQNPPDLHFGVGEAANIDEIRVVWPDQTELVCNDVAVNQFLVFDQRDGAAACPAGP
jgi:cytochrome c peroxidase